MVRGAAIGFVVIMLLTAVATWLMFTGAVYAQQAPRHVFSGSVLNAEGKAGLSESQVSFLDMRGYALATGLVINGRYRVTVKEDAGSNFSGQSFGITIRYQNRLYERAQRVNWQAGGNTTLDLEFDGESLAAYSNAGLQDSASEWSLTKNAYPLKDNCFQISWSGTGPGIDYFAVLGTKVQLPVRPGETVSVSGTRYYDGTWEVLQYFRLDDFWRVRIDKKWQGSPPGTFFFDGKNPVLCALMAPPVPTPWPSNSTPWPSSPVAKDHQRIEAVKKQIEAEKKRVEEDRRRWEQEEDQRRIEEERQRRMESEDALRRELMTLQSELENKDSARRMEMEEELMELERQRMESEDALRRELMTLQSERENKDREQRREIYREMMDGLEVEKKDRMLTTWVEMERQRMEMDQQRIEADQPGVQPVAGESPKSGPSRGLFSNNRAGEAASGIDNIMDPGMLTIIGIAFTVLTTGMTLFKGD